MVTISPKKKKMGKTKAQINKFVTEYLFCFLSDRDYMRPRPTTECKSLDHNTGGASPWAAIKWQCTYTNFG